MLPENVLKIIKRVKTDIEQKGESELPLVDQMTLAETGVNLQNLCIDENWIPEHGGVDSSIKIFELPDGYEYEKSPGRGLLPEIVTKATGN